MGLFRLHTLTRLLYLCHYCSLQLLMRNSAGVTVELRECFWPELEEENVDSSISVEVEESKKAVKALFIADIHVKKSRWFNELRREWQIYKAFKTAISLFEPEVVFILGDLLDDGVKLSNQDFQYYVKKINLLFEVSENTKVYFVAGNHDVGFHFEVTERLHKRFTKALKAPPVYQVSIRGNHFVLINSMAMEGDGCFLCRPAQLELNRIAKKLKCAKGIGKCPLLSASDQYSRPILVQHFPMYRESDRHCFEIDEAPAEVKNMDFREGWDCLSKEASEKIYDILNPRVIVGGHTHHGCHVIHRNDIHEYSLSSFNWRNKNNPSFLMGVFLPNNYAARRCYIPQESTVRFLYCIGFAIILLFIMFSLSSAKTYYRL